MWLPLRCQRVCAADVQAIEPITFLLALSLCKKHDAITMAQIILEMTNKYIAILPAKDALSIFFIITIKAFKFVEVILKCILTLFALKRFPTAASVPQTVHKYATKNAPICPKILSFQEGRERY
jgi:hypothetical protein